ELQWGEWVRRLVPSAGRVRCTGRGTEATLMAVRVARVVTGKSQVVKVAGPCDGWHDQLIPAAEPPQDDPAYPTPGITSAVNGDLVVLPPNNLEATERALEEHDPACVIVEATGGRWGVVPIDPEFLRGLRKLTEKRNVLLIFDEVISGFRVHPGRVQALFD